MNKSIGVFDSGIGGMTVLEELKRVLPKENYIYYGDSLNNPYGEKNDEELLKIVCNVVDILISKNVKIIVIACNTATTRCMKKLRKLYPDMIFVGTVPAIKMACDKGYKNTLVMATPATIFSRRTHELISDNKKDGQSITLLSCDGLAHLIEIGDKKGIITKLNSIFNNYLDSNIDSIVLGCTHYPLIKDEINSYFPEADLLDGSNGVAREVKRQLELHDLLNDNGNCNCDIYNSLD